MSDVIRRKMVLLIDTITEDFCWRAQKLVDEEYCTPEDILIALGDWLDFQDAWIDWMENYD